MVVKFKDFINYDKRIGKMIITGVEGAGKTMLLARIAIGKMLHGMEDCWKSYERVEEYNRLGFHFSTDYEHLLFSNFDINCAGTTMPDRVNYRCNPYRLGLFSPYYKTDFYPPGALFCIMEGYNFLNSQLYDMFPENFKGWMRTCRQAGYDLVIDSHSFMDIFNQFRKLTKRFIHLYKEVEEIKDREGHIVDHRLFIREFTNYIDAEKYEQSSVKNNCKEYELLLGMYMYPCYDTEQCRYLHLEGRENDDFTLEQSSPIENIDDLDHIGEKMGILPPEGYFVGKYSREKKKNEPPETKIINTQVF